MCPALCHPLDHSLQAPLSVGSRRQEFWSGLPCRSPGDLLYLGIEPGSLALQVDSLPAGPPGKPVKVSIGVRGCEVAQLCPALCSPVDCTHQTPLAMRFPARILEWVAISSSRGSFDPGIEAMPLASPALADESFTSVPPGKPLDRHILSLITLCHGCLLTSL